MHKTIGLQHFYGKEPCRLLLATSRAARGEITVTGTPNRLYYFANCCSVYAIYKCDHGQRVRDPYIRTLQPRGPTKCTCQFAAIIISHIMSYKFGPLSCVKWIQIICIHI